MKNNIIILLLILVMSPLHAIDKEQLDYYNPVGSLGIGLIKVSLDSFELLRDENISSLNINNLPSSVVPIFYKPDYGIVYFICIKNNINSFKVRTSYQNDITLNKNSATSFISWPTFLQKHVTSIGSKSKLTPNVYKSASKNSKKIHWDFDDEFEIIKVKGKCLKMKSKISSGWVQWRNDYSLLLEIYLLM